jgi:hypothetical protein
MTGYIDRIEKLALERRFHEEARGSRFPLLRSASLDTILAGYSLTKWDRGMMQVETNQVSRRLRPDGLPVWFTNRTTAQEYDSTSWISHAAYHVMNSDLEILQQQGTKAGHDALISRLMKPERYDRDILVDGQIELAEAFDFEGTVFARLKPRSGFELTIAAPEFIMQAGFVSGVPD